MTPSGTGTQHRHRRPHRYRSAGRRRAPQLRGGVVPVHRTTRHGVAAFVAAALVTLSGLLGIPDVGDIAGLLGLADPAGRSGAAADQTTADQVATDPAAGPQPTAGAAPRTSAVPAGPPLPPAPGQAETAVEHVADPVRVLVPAIGVDAEVLPVALRPDGQLVPEHGSAGWYTEGPRPGEPGPAVIVAHVSSRGGPDVFADLWRLQPGDVIETIRADGTTGRWQVRSSEQTPKDQLPTDRIWDGTTEPVLRLITCGGTVQADGHFSDNVIVYAEPITH